MNRKNLVRWWISLLMCAQLAGCALPGFLTFKGTKLDWSDVTLSAAPGANQNSPIAVDVVLVYQDDMLDRLAELPAAKWFGVRADLRKTFPKSLSYRTWELVPGQTIQVAGESFGSPRVVGVLIYADYATPGAHRLRVETLKGAIVVRFDNQNFDVSTAQ